MTEKSIDPNATVSDIRLFLLCPRRLYYMNSAAGLRRIREASEKAMKKYEPPMSGTFDSYYFFTDDHLKKYESEILKESIFEIPYRLVGSPEFGDFRRVGIFSGPGKLENPEMSGDSEMPENSEISNTPTGQRRSECIAEELSEFETIPAAGIFPYVAGSVISSIYYEYSNTPNLFSANDTYELQKRLHFKLPEIIKNLMTTACVFGSDIFEALADPAEKERLLISERLSLSGTVPKILSIRINNSGCFAPYIIRTSKPPENGVWESDRIAAAAYLMLFEEYVRMKNERRGAGGLEKEVIFETPDKSVNSENSGISDAFSASGKIRASDKLAGYDGRKETSEQKRSVIMRPAPIVFIDYLGEIRYAAIHLNDRKAVFRAIRHIKRIKNGEMPEKKRGKLCSACIFKDMCRPKEKTLFNLIGKNLRIRIWNTNVEYKCGIQMWNTNVEYKCGIQMWNTNVEYKIEK